MKHFYLLSTTAILALSSLFSTQSFAQSPMEQPRLECYFAEKVKDKSAVFKPFDSSVYEIQDPSDIAKVQQIRSNRSGTQKGQTSASVTSSELGDPEIVLETFTNLRDRKHNDKTVARISFAASYFPVTDKIKLTLNGKLQHFVDTWGDGIKRNYNGMLAEALLDVGPPWHLNQSTLTVRANVEELKLKNSNDQLLESVSASCIFQNPQYSPYTGYSSWTNAYMRRTPYTSRVFNRYGIGIEQGLMPEEIGELPR